MRFSRTIGTFPFDRAMIGILLVMAVLLTGRGWLADHPQHDPWAPLNLAHPPGWATQAKLAALRNDPAECRAVLRRSGVAFESLDPVGEGECRRSDRVVLQDAPLSPSGPQVTCPVAAAFHLWLRQGIQPAAQEMLGSRVAKVQHLGTYSCRRVNGASTGNWSEHATGNAIDIAGFVLEDGRQIGLIEDWDSADGKGMFLREARQSACKIFGTVLSPDYNAAHADHFHLDQASCGWGGMCR